MPVEPNLSALFPSLSALTPLARGGQKSVYTGDHKEDGKVVLKIIHAHQEPERTVREIDAVRKINSPRVPIIYETGSVNLSNGPAIWIREQFITGESLRANLKTGKLPPCDAICLAIQILEALHSAHQARIIHRDVKPDNIMVASDKNYWLLDFGIARHLDLQSLTSTNGNAAFTAGYAPPEQFQNRKREIDGRADLFSLGVTLYECLHGANPFRNSARDNYEVCRRIEGGPMPEFNIEGDSDRRLREFVRVLMQRRIDHRPASSSEALHWAKELQQYFPRV